MLEVSKEPSYDRIYCYIWHGNDSCYHHSMEIVLCLYNLAAIILLKDILPLVLKLDCVLPELT